MTGQSSETLGREPPVIASGDYAHLRLFMKRRRPQDAPRCAVVFIHGIAGDALGSWGPEGEPCVFPRRIAEELHRPDVLLAGYRSDLDSIFDDEALTLDTLTKSWKALLLNHVFLKYEKVFFIAHCLGGLLTTMSLRQIIQDDWVMPAIRILLLETLHILPPKHALRMGTGGIALALDCDALEFSENVSFWNSVFSRQRVISFDFRAEAMIGRLEGFIAPWRPDACLPSAAISRCNLLHDNLSRPPVDGPFPPLDRAILIGRSFFQ